MGLYAEQIFARVMDWCMDSRRFQEQRREILVSVHGAVLEIGFGTGLNLSCYSKAVSTLTAVEPANLLPQKVAQRLSEGSFLVELVRVSAESMPFESGRFDCVVSTWTLCTIPNAVAALREVRRVLKPGGRFVFLEHGRSDDPRVARWQDRLNPLQRVVACGCNLNRPIGTLILQAGLRVNTLDRYRMPGVPRIAGEMYRGIASP